MRAISPVALIASDTVVYSRPKFGVVFEELGIWNGF